MRVGAREEVSPMQDTAICSEFSISFPKDELSARRFKVAIEQAVVCATTLARLNAAEATFEDFERATLEVLNEVGRRCLEAELQRKADVQPQQLDIEGWPYR